MLRSAEQLYLYGVRKNSVVKTHKENYPTRSVLSAINTPEYNLAKWLEKKRIFVREIQLKQ